MKESYRVCLSDYSSILLELAVIIGANYVIGSFEKAEEKFIYSGQSSENWFLVGENGRLVVTFEQYEGYYFSEFTAVGLNFQEGKELLINTYLAQGGNPAVL